jgi:IS30 family transposase
MAIQTPAFRMADRMVGGRLLEIVREELAAGRSPEEISRTLYADHGVEVSGTTLRRWLAQEPAA